MLTFLFVVHARILEVIHVGGLAMVLAVLGLFGALVGGDILSAIRSRVGLLLIAFTLWIAITIPTSSWPGGSMKMLTDVWSKNVIVFFMMVAVFTRTPQCLRVFHVLALATVTIVLLSYKYGTMQTGRLQFMQGSLANPNDFSMYLLVGLSFCLFAFQRSGLLMKMFWMVGLAALVNTVLKTGSRSGLLTMGIMFALLVFRSGLMTRLAIGGLAVGLLFAAPLFLPRSVLVRYALIFSSEGSAEGGDSKQAEFAAGSTEGRSALLKKSLIMTLQNPLVGVGIGRFASASADVAKTAGRRAEWLQSHNLYTQLSSELGLPGIALYLAAVYFGLMNLRFAGKVAALSKDRGLAQMASWLQFSYLAFLFNGLFSSSAYHLNIIILLGLSQALRTAAEGELSSIPGRGTNLGPDVGNRWMKRTVPADPRPMTRS